MRLILPIILALLGIAGGGYAGYLMKPAPEPASAVAEDGASDKPEAATPAAKGETRLKGAEAAGHKVLPRAPGKATDSAYVPIERKLIVPIRRASGRKAFVALDATLEIDPSEKTFVASHEPKIVDAFLRVLIAFAATGAFDDHAETAMALDDLHDALLNSAQAVLGEKVRGVLIANLITQDA